MNRFKKIVCLLCVAVLMLAMSVSVAAAGSGDYKISLRGLIDNSNKTNITYEFKVTCTLMDESDDAKEVVSEKKVSYNSKSKSQYDFYLDAEHVENGGYAYEFKMLDCSSTSAGVDTRVVTIYLLKDEWGEKIIKVYDPSLPEDEVEQVIDEFPYLIEFNCKTGMPVSVEFLKEKLTKVYDGTDAYTLSEDDYKLSGVAEGDEVSLVAGSAKFDAVDVKNATKVTLSELSLNGKDAAKYVFKTAEVTSDAEITPRPITVTADSKVMAKGEQSPELTYSLSEPLIPGNEFMGNLVRQQGTEVGEYTISRGTLTLNDNYEVTFVEGKLTISNFVLSTVVDSATSISVSGHFAGNTKLNVSNLSVSDNIYKLLAANSTWGDIIKGYNISLDGAHDGTLEITIPVGANYDSKIITVYQYLTSGGIASYKAAVTNGAVTVSAKEGTAFLLVADKGDAGNKMSVGAVVLTVILILLAVVGGLALLFVLFFFGMIFFNKTEELKKIMKAIKRLLRKRR